MRFQRIHDAAKSQPIEDGHTVHWWILIPIAAAVGAALYGLLRWASGDPGIDVEEARQHFRAEQDWRGLRRSNIDPGPSGSHKPL